MLIEIRHVAIFNHLNERANQEEATIDGDRQ